MENVTKGRWEYVLKYRVRTCSEVLHVSCVSTWNLALSYVGVSTITVGVSEIIISQIHDHLCESHKNELIDQEEQTWLPGEKEISSKAASRENCSLMLLVVKHSIKPQGAVPVSPALEQGSDAKF